MMTMNPWVPKSPCDPSCIDAGLDTVSPVTAGLRVARLVALLAAFPIVNLATPRRWRDRVQRAYARKALRCFGIELSVVDGREAGAPAGTYAQRGCGMLLVSGHVGWTDVLVLAAVQPVSFVARADLIDWPLMGKLARLMRVIPIDRASLRQLPAVVETIGARLSAGERVVVFPEATTWCGRAYGRMRPALFQAAIDTQTPVQPVRVRYVDSTGVLTTQPGFVGTETLAASLKRLLRVARVTAEVMLPEPLAPGSDRRELARQCETAIRGGVQFDFSAHAQGPGPMLRPARPPAALERAS